MTLNFKPIPGKDDTVILLVHGKAMLKMEKLPYLKKSGSTIK
jgi:hypothetical protein